MPPEQLLGEEVDARADLYAVGVVLFEAATGRLPFEAASPMLLIARLLQEEAPRASSVDPSIPAELDALLAELLAKRPDARIQTAVAAEGPPGRPGVAVVVSRRCSPES